MIAIFQMIVESNDMAIGIVDSWFHKIKVSVFGSMDANTRSLHLIWVQLFSFIYIFKAKRIVWSV